MSKPVPLPVYHNTECHVLPRPKPWSLLLTITHLSFLQITPSLPPPPTRHTSAFHPQPHHSHNDPYRAKWYSSNNSKTFGRCQVECHPAYRPSRFPVTEMPGWIPEAAPSQARVCGRLLGLRVRIPPRAWVSVSCEWCVLSGLCVGLITHPDESYRVCVSLSVIRYNNNPLHLHWGIRRFETKNDRKASMTPQSKEDCFLPHPFHFMIRQSSYHIMSDPDNVVNKPYINTALHN